jgi:hypothetical protein
MKCFGPALALMAYFMTSTSFAQQPGTPQYNSVFLPAHGAGDTRQPPRRWGAVARGDDLQLGWSVNGDSEDQAGNLAVRDCSARGSRNCQVVNTFSNSCAVVVVGQSDRNFLSLPRRSLDKVRKTALKECGPECRVMFEGCALP